MYSVSDVASLVQRHPKTVLRHIHTGQLKADRVGRTWQISRDALRSYTHAELAGASQDRFDAALDEKMQTSAQIVLRKGDCPDGERLIASITALLNSHREEENRSDMRVDFEQGSGDCRILLHGSPSFLAVVFASLDAFVKGRDV